MKSRKNNKKFIVALVVLAIICIGTVELIACRIFDPALFDRITAPVIRTANAAVASAENYYANLFRLAAEHASRIIDDAVPEETLESQLVSEPDIITVPADPTITELREVDGKAVLTGGPVKVEYYNQGDEPWSGMPYGRDNIGSYGCGPTAMAMVVASMTEHDTDPGAMAQWAADHGYWARRSGSYLSIVRGISEDFGLTAESFTERSPDNLKTSLLSGNLIVALMGPGHFTKSGHFIILRGVTLSGDILVADPSSLDRSLTTWDAQLILDELSSSTSDGAPLWEISAG